MEAKLVKPPPGGGFRKEEPLKLEKPDPSVPSFEAAVVAKGEGPAAPANPLAAGFSGSEVAAGLNKEGLVDLPRELKGDSSEPAKAAKLEDANAEDEVVGFFSELSSFSSSSFLEVGFFDDARALNGDTSEVFEKALFMGLYRKK